ncbi:MAG TPA: toxin TcdB middle/N-terminal domain-containing protein, partial [Polyangiaceae bacterium]
MIRLVSWLVVAALMTASLVARASGVDPTKLSLPSGPASIEGLGRNFEPSLSTGTASYGIEIAVPPAAGGFSPKLSLDYDSGGGVSELGMGWRIGGLPTIRRRVNEGLPRFDDSDALEISGVGLPSDLLETEAGLYRPELESGAFVRVVRSDGGDEWEARVKSGVVFRFGGSGYTEHEGDHVATYLLREQLDLHGHRIAYEWDTSEGHALLERVVWNDFGDEVRQELVLSYESRPDAHELFSTGIRQVLSKRLATVEVLLGGRLVRRYSLEYSEAPHSRLERVTMVGTDGETALPTLSFDYTEPSFASDDQVIAMESPPGRSPADGDTTLADLNGDSLPDLLVAEAGSYQSYVNQDGLGWSAGNVWKDSVTPSVSLSTDGAQLADVDGDGAIDLLVKSAADEFRYFPGLGATEFAASRDIRRKPNFSFEDPDVRLADFDGDRRVDVAITTDAGLSISYNLGGQDWEDPVDVGVIDARQPLRFSDHHVSLCDMNGDRVQDFCSLLSESLTYWLGRGRGQFEPAREAEGVPDFEDGEPYRLIDLNGDGWVDLVHVGVGRVFYALAVGMGSFDEARTIEDTPPGGPDVHVEFADMNGSGTTDIVWIDVAGSEDEAWRYLELFPQGRGGLLSRIDNGLGKVTTIEYTSAAQLAAEALDGGHEWSTRLNVATAVVSRVTLDSSLGDPLLVTEYSYRDGTWDPVERTFAGFVGGTQVQLGDDTTPTLVTESEFDVGLEYRPLRGAVLESEQRDESGGVFGRTTNGYEKVELEESTDDRRVLYAYKASERVEHIELGDEAAARTTLTEWQQDAWGNVVEERRWGEVEGDDELVGDDEAITRTTYAINERDWLVGFVATRELLNAKGERVALERNYYDGEPFQGLPLGEVARGDLSRSEAWVGPGEGDFEVVSASRFDAHGNVLEARDALGGGRNFVWDDASHTLVTEERVLTGERELVQRAEYDPALGTMVAFWDFNGVVTRFEHDALGRLTAIAKPGDTVELPTVSYVYELGHPLSVILTDKRVSSGRPETERSYAVHDGLGRRRAGILMAEEDRWVLGAVSLLDARGNVRKTLRPRFIEKPSLEPRVLLEDAEGEESFRDATGRTVRTLTVMGRETRTEYHPFLMRGWDAAQSDSDSPYSHVPTETMTDGLGRTIAVVRWDEDEAITTNARYSAAGEMVELTDPEGNVARYGYDGRSRRVWIDDPDAGEHRFIFDAASNLVEHIHPDETSWTFRHDLVGRVLREDWNGDGTAEVTRRYDSGDNGLGKLTGVDDAVGSLDVEYDERGRVAERTRLIEGERYASRYWYDAQDREVLHGFADGSTLRTYYSPRGLIERYGEDLLALTYDADGKETTRRFATGIEERFLYDEDQRLTEHRALAEDGSVLQHLTWQYDGVDNVLEVTDRRSGVDRGRSRSLTAEYDDLYRLRHARGAWGETSYSYTPSGLMDAKNSDDTDEDVGELDYGDEAGPHALTGFEERALEYDPRGRLTDDGMRHYRWDAGDRLLEVSHASGAEVHNVFDGDGERRVRREISSDGQESTTIFLDDWSELHDGKLVRYLV